MRILLVEIAALMVFNGCLVDERCQSLEDCPSPKVCNQQGRCVWECTTAEECGTGFNCEGHLCVPAEAREIVCPPDMVKVGELFCIDRYEASRPDAAADFPGLDETMAVSLPGVLPWTLDDNNPLADAACAAAGKRLCSSFEWELACRGPAMTVYGYGDSYNETICNGIDTFGPGGVKLLPTGSFEDCVNGWGIYDMNGNLWEHVAGGDGKTVRGGAYNCIDSMSLHRCDYVPRTWVPSALGFRCCLSPEGAVDPGDIREEPDAGVLDLPGNSDGPGCLDPDLGPSLDVDIEVAPPECLEDNQCLHLLTGESQCLDAVCLEGGICALQPSLDGASCEDGDPCSVGDGCVEGQCEPGKEALNCDDMEPCTDDECVAGLGCQYSPNQAPCNDGDPCTLGDGCGGGSCVPGVGTLVCVDDNLCTDDECVPFSGCQNTPNSDPCDDGNPCTEPDVCQGGECLGGEVICTCEQDEDCPQDDNLCNGVLFCDKAQWPYVCIVDAASTVECEQPLDPCLKSVCQPADGSCSIQPVANGKPCDDDNQCTTEDTCVAGECSGGSNICQCFEDLDCLPYEDENLCNGTLICNKGVFPFECIVDGQTVVVCVQPADPCLMAECQPTSGGCMESASPEGTPCDDGDICNGSDQCLAGVCVSGTQSLCACPADMVSVNDDYCLDRYEASRADATAQFMGYDMSMATSRPNVIPWFPVEYAAAKVACEAADKRLCTEAEIELACGGPEGWTYLYGNDYSATICNGIDAFCLCDSPNCAGLEFCPYPHCYSMSPEGVYGEGCGAAFHVAPTGTFEECVNPWGAYDVNGNAWELVDTGNGESWYKGGAYNCGNSEWLHQCQEKFQNISAKGFRCCLDIQI